MNKVWRKLKDFNLTLAMKLRGVLRGMSRHLGSVFIAVLLAPVLPDVMVDVLGVDGLAAGGVRIASVLVVVLFCAPVYWLESRVYRKRIGQVSARSSSVKQHDTLVLALSGATQVRRPGDRIGWPTVGEILLDAVKPRRVVLVSAPGSQSEEWLYSTRAALDEVGIASTTLSMRSPDLVDWLDEDLRREIEHDRANGESWESGDVLFDLTGGKVPMSLAMLKVAANVGADCVYMSSEHDRSGPLPGTMEARQIDPKTLIGGVIE